MAGNARFRWFALTSIIASKLPIVLAFAMAAFNLAADHEVRFELRDSEMKVILHHGAHLTGQAEHQHNLFESALVGKPTSHDDSDHYFSLAHSPTVTEEEKLQPYQLDKVPCSALLDAPHSLSPSAVESTCMKQPDSRAAQTPGALRRGVVMRV